MIQIAGSSLTVERAVVVCAVKFQSSVAVIGGEADIPRVWLVVVLARGHGRRLFNLLLLESVMKDFFGPRRTARVGRTLSPSFLLFAWPERVAGEVRLSKIHIQRFLLNSRISPHLFFLELEEVRSEDVPWVGGHRVARQFGSALALSVREGTRQGIRLKFK